MDEILQVKRKTIPINSVIMSCVGNLGICSIAGQELIINQQLHSFQCKEVINNIYLMFALGFKKDAMYRTANSTTVAYMNKTSCNNIKVPLPPLLRQNKFAVFVERVDMQKAKLKKSFNLLELNYKSLMQKCFSGEIF